MGAVFAEIVGDERLADDFRALGRHAGIHSETLRSAIAYAGGDDTASPAGTPTASASLALARAASYSRARIDEANVQDCRDNGLSPAAVVENVTWLSVLQLLHRLTSYVKIAD